MFPTFIGILDIQSWWEVPSIAHFCSLFRDAFNLLDFDIEDLEEALLTDSGTEGHLLQELIVRLLEGCLPQDTRNDISTFNYQMFLRRLFRKKCQEYKRENPFNTDTDFELLPLRQKVEILRALCDFRLDANNVEESLGDLDSDSLRVEPLGHDRKNSAYWYFYGTRLYREDFVDSPDTLSQQKQKGRPRDKRHKRRRGRLAKEEEEEEEKEEDCLVYTNGSKGRESIWQVVCFTLQDWSRLVEKFKDSEFATERKLYKTLSKDFMPEIPKLFDLKEKQQRRKILQRSSARPVQSIDSEDNADEAPTTMVKSKVKTKSNKITKKSSSQAAPKNAKAKEEVVPNPPVTKKGRQTNNSLASVDGQILIDTCDELTDLETKKSSVKHGGSVSSGYGYGYEIGIEEEEQQVGMHKVLKILKDHEDAWPFTDPVDEQYAPRYYSVVRKPMDLTTMEDKLDDGAYKTVNQFKRDFRLIIDNCRQYNGSDNEYTEMAMNLKDIFDKAVERYLEIDHSSDDSLSERSGASVGSPNYKNKASSPSSVVRHSQRHKHSRKLSKKDKSNNKIHKKHTRQRAYEESDEKEESEVEVKVTKEKKKDKKKSKKCKSEVKVEEKVKEEQDENEGAISDENVIKSIKKKSTDTDKAVSKSKKVSVKEEIDEKPIVKSSKKQKKESKQEKGIHLTKEKESRKRKEDFEEDHEICSIPKSKSRKIEKKENKELDVLINRVKKSKKEVDKKVKKDESLDTSLEEDEKLSSVVAKSNKKSRKLNKEKSDSPNKHNKKEKNKKSKKKSNESLKNGKIEKDGDVENIENKLGKSAAKNIDSIVTNKDIESLDSLKDRISERRREEKLKIEQEKKKKQSSKSDALYGTLKKVPSNGSTYHDIVDKLGGGKKVKSKKVNKDDKSIENKSQNQDESEPKKIKTPPTKHAKGSGKGDPAIQALHQATERTLNDINKWLDDAPKLSEFSSGSDSPVLQASTSNSDASRATTAATTNKQSSTGAVGGDASRKRPSSIKLIGPIAPVRPKKVQRTIDRLQPGKSKGNLLSKKPPSNESAPSADPAVSNKDKDNDNDKDSKETSDEPKLSLGTVLKNVDSIQLICKSIVSSPNPNGSNDEDDECGSKPATPAGIAPEEDKTATATKKPLTTVTGTKDGKDEKEKRVESEESAKPKSATPNLSAWFKAFGAPKSKKKEEEEEAAPKKEEIPDTSIIGMGTRQRRMSTGGSSVSESVSSYSQESPPSRTGRSPQQQPPQQPQPSSSMLPSPAAMEPQLRGAGFYQDALSTGSSPYNSPYYTTPPRYSAQLPPTPSPQHHPLSPAYPSTQPTPPRLYSQISPSHQSFQKPSPQAQSPQAQSPFSQQSPQSEPYVSPSIPPAQNQSPIYPQQSPSSMQSSPYPQPSPQPANYSQPSPQQPPTPNYSQPSPQTPANYSQPSPQQQHSPYSQSSPQPPPSYSQPSPQSQHSPYSQPSPQQSNFSQVSPRPPSSTYSQPSPQPPGYTAQTPSPYSQPDLVIAQPSPRGYSQTSPQTPSPYSAQASPQQQPPSYSQASPQTPPSYSQPSPQQQPRSYSQPSPQQSTPHQQQPPPPQQQQQQQQQQQPVGVPQISNYPQQAAQIQAQSPAAGFAKAPENYSQNLSPSPFSHPVKSPYSGSTPIAKPTATKDKHVQQQQQQQQSTDPLTALNQQVYQSASTTPQYPPNYPSGVFSGTDPTARSSASRLANHEAAQQAQLAQQRQVQQTQEQQSQLLSFQQNLAASHESLYSSSFQTTPYPMPNPACRPVYPGYFDASAKSSSGIPSPSNSLAAPVKKRTYNEPSAASEPQVPTQRPGQDQFGFDQLMALAHSQSEVSNQFDNAFANSLAESNPAYARLQLGLVGRTAKETQQLLSIPRPPSKNDPLTAYGRTATPGQSELDLNLLQSFAAKSSGMLSMSQRRGPEQPPVAQPAPTTTKPKKTKKSKAQQQQQLQQQQQQQQQQQAQALSVGSDQQIAGMAAFPQYGAPPGSDPMSLKQPSSAFNFAGTAGATNSSPYYDAKDAAAYAFALDEFRNPNSQIYYSIALQQQQQAQQQAAHQQAQQQSTPVSEAAVQAANKQTAATVAAARNYPFLHSAATQRASPYAPAVPSYVSPHGANLGVDPAAYQRYLQYYMHPPPHTRPAWL